MRAAGAVLVVLSCSVFGLSMAKTLRIRVEFLRGIAGALALLRNELCESLLPVCEVLEALASDRASPSNKFFARCFSLFESGDLKNAWVTAAMACGAWGMDSEECRILAGLDSVIGRYEAGKQRELIDRVIVYLDGRIKLAEEENRRQYKLRAALGLGSGLMLAILML